MDLRELRLVVVVIFGIPICKYDVHEFQWTLMGYMIEGGGSKTMSKAKYWLENYADDSKKLLDILTSVIVDYFEMQVVNFWVH